MMNEIEKEIEGITTVKGKKEFITPHVGRFFKSIQTITKAINSFEKARTPGAKDKQKRKRRMIESHLQGHSEALAEQGYERGSISHPKVHFYRKEGPEGNLILINRKTGNWSHYNNEKGFVKEGAGHEDLKRYLPKI